MAHRPAHRQSEHDAAVAAAAQIYREHAKHAWTNPDGEKNKIWAGYYIDVIAVSNKNDDRAWVIEVETEDSVSEAEAKGQWKEYDQAYTTVWYLAVPVASKPEADRLIQRHAISHCTVLTWRRNDNGTHTFWGLPGVS